jgi:hypothetical protein
MTPTAPDRVGAPRRAPASAVGLLLVGLASVVLAGAPAAAQDGSITRSEAARLAGEAATDDAALRELRDVRTIDGRPVDLRPVVDGVGDGPGRARALRGLARDLGGGAGAPAADRAEARRAAREVLDREKFREKELPKPFRGPLRWLTDRLRPVGRFLQRIYEPILDAADVVPGGRFILFGLLLGLAGVGSVLVARRAGRAAITGQRGTWGGLVDPTLDPEELDRRAAEAEAGGRWSEAVRLRYEAGLVRLVRADRLVLRPDTTAGDAARQVDLPPMHAATRTFEAVVYGGRRATADDAAESRSAWLEVLGAAARRGAPR